MKPDERDVRLCVVARERGSLGRDIVSEEEIYLLLKYFRSRTK